MKLKELFGNWANAIKVFPVSHIILLLISIVGIFQVEGIIDLDSPDLIFCLVLAFIISCYGPLFIVHSNLKNRNVVNRTLQIGSIILGGLYFILLHNIDFDDLTYSESLVYVRILPLVLLGIPLIIAILHKKQESKIWFSWTSLFISIIFGGIAGSIIWGGISGALASIEALFDVNIDSDLYTDIGFLSEILLAGSFVFNYYLTLTKNINKKTDFKINPYRLRKIFGSFIFLPLAVIYLLIFGSYGIKILITGVWPKGIIVWLGIGYFTLGIISSYLIYPDNAKINEIIKKIFYVSFILIAFMMIGAISQRIDQYGITINRCFVCYIITFIIIFSVLSLIFSKNRLIIFISTLTILFFISVYGWPINVNNISFKSQVNRLETLLSKENISLPLNEGVLKDTNENSTKLIIGMIDGLVENYNKDKIINKVINFEYEDSYWSSRSDIREFLGVNSDYDYYYYYPTNKYRNYRQYGKADESINIEGYSKILYFEKYSSDVDDMFLKLYVDDMEYKLDLSGVVEELKLKANIYEKSDLTDKEEETLKEPALVILEENYKIVVNGFSMEENKEGNTYFSNVEGYILVK